MARGAPAVSLVIEPHGSLVDDLAAAMADNAGSRLEPEMRVARLAELLREHSAWALAVDFRDPSARRLFWYVSEEKLEPRLGDRFSEPGAERELPLDIARQVQTLAAALDEAAPVRAWRNCFCEGPISATSFDGFRR